MPLPANVGTGTITGTIIDAAGSPAIGVVSFLPKPVRLLDAAADVVIVGSATSVRLDSAGSFSAVLIATDDPDLNPVQWTYGVTVAVVGQAVWTFDVDVPAGTTRNLADIAPVAGSPGNAIVVGPAGPPGPSVKEHFYSIPGTVAVAVGAMRIPFPRAATITNVAAMVNTQPTGASLIIDVNKNGTTIFTTQANRPTIAVSTNADNTSTPDVTAMAANDYLTVDVDQVGSTVAGADLTVRIDVTEALG